MRKQDQLWILGFVLCLPLVALVLWIQNVDASRIDWIPYFLVVAMLGLYVMQEADREEMKSQLKIRDDDDDEIRLF